MPCCPEPDLNPTTLNPAHAKADTPDHLRPRGSSQGGLRQYNERVVLQALRLHGALPAAELARLTHLTAQTISMITKRLLDDGLLRKGQPVRGKVGQPSVPLSLNPDGAFSIGIKLGRRSLDVLLLDFAGAVRERWAIAYDFPDPDAVLPEIAQRLQDIRSLLGPARSERLQGIGIAAPLQLSAWRELLGADAAVAAKWDRVDLRAAVEALSGLPVHLLKDTAAACVAELVAGRGRALTGFLYVFVDTFIGGGLVLDSHLRAGLNGNAGAIGSLPMGLSQTGEPPAQLLGVASLLNLERAWAAGGLATDVAGDERALQDPWASLTRAWLAQAGAAVALAVNSAACLLDLEAVVLDGSFSPALRGALQAAVQSALNGYDWRGVVRPAVLPGTIGSDARALGGALLPLYANFAPDRDLFLKVAA
ncbi:MAG: ROK family transcriptional regulator [Rubrivivax sp.]|nr:ROK family transcriptional regulator [Rubrivivax sp.]